MWYMPIKQQFPFLVYPVRWTRWLSTLARYPNAVRQIERRTRGQVIAGPFKGLRYPGRDRGNFSVLLGAYESCLAPAVESVISRKPKLVINVGAAYGYYAFGLARRLPESSGIAYELDRSRQVQLMRYRKLNQLEDRVVLRGACTLESLNADINNEVSTFICMDVEGGEAELLDPEKVPGLRRAEILVELHEMFSPGVTALLKRRFADTHSQGLILESHADSLNASALGIDGISGRTLRRFIDERRGMPMSWLHLRPKTG